MNIGQVNPAIPSLENIVPENPDKPHTSDSNKCNEVVQSILKGSLYGMGIGVFSSLILGVHIGTSIYSNKGLIALVASHTAYGLSPIVIPTGAAIGGTVGGLSVLVKKIVKIYLNKQS